MSTTDEHGTEVFGAVLYDERTATDGGVAIAGGSGSVLGAALGAVVLGTIQTALIVLRIDDFWQQAIVGLLIIVAIALDRLIAKQSEALLRQRSARRRTAA